jgi:DNA-binding response OmpR family regulator
MRNILVIDDERPILKLIQYALSQAGFDAEVAPGGREGIQKFEDGSYDVVITDIRMPGVDGRDVVNHIRNSNRPQTPIIGCSGTPWLLEDSTFDTVFEKPFKLKELVHSVQMLSSKAASAV